MTLPKVRRSSVNIDKLLNSEYNPRNISNEALSALRSSIEKFGLVQEIVVNERNNKIIGGHQRVKALKASGVTDVNVAYVDLEERDEKALNVALNSPHLMGTFTDELHDLMDELHADDYPDFEELRFEDFSVTLDAQVTQNETSLNENPIKKEDELDDPNIKPSKIMNGEKTKINNTTLICGDCINEMKNIEENTIDAIVTDPPYGIGFMGKEWDHNVPGEEWARECLRVLKPGGHIVAFGATRTIHRLTLTLEDAGFEIRDQISWLQWQGFPKSMNIGREAGCEKFKGWGTALKPSYEPAVLARKETRGTVAKNVANWGTGAINIDGCRYPADDTAWPGPQNKDPENEEFHRFPANIYHCPKPPRSEKEAGLENEKGKTGAQATSRKAGSKGLKNPRAGAGRTAENVKNFHPTVKPINLMRWLVRLVTPPGGVVLDTFLGSGTTCVAAEREGLRSIGIEKSAEYAGIAKARVQKAAQDQKG